MLVAVPTFTMLDLTSLLEQCLGLLGWASYRLYHLPLRRSKGMLAWGPRSEHHAFLAYNKDDDGIVDEELGRLSMGTELDYLSLGHPARVHTGGFHQPIVEHSGDESQRGNTAYNGQRV